MTDISIVIPVRNEAATLRELVVRLTAVMQALNVTYEIIFVTDVNTDDTVAVLRDLHRADAHVKPLKLSNAFGHHAAVYAGLAKSRGAAVVIMDGDLQDEPEDIPRLFECLRAGYDVVYGVKERKNESRLRNACSRAFVTVLTALSDHKVQYNTCMFRIVSRRVVNAVLQFQENEPSLTFIMSLIGFLTAAVTVTSGVRAHGRTKFPFWRQVNFAITSLLSFSTKPLRLISCAGLALSGLSLLYLLEMLIEKLAFGRGTLGWPTVVGLLCLLGGMILFAQGVTGEYIARIFVQSKRRPLYIVEEWLGDESS